MDSDFICTFDDLGLVNACSRHLYALQRAMADITKDKIELQGSIGSNFMPKYRKMRTSNDKHVPEFMRIALS